MAKNRNQTGFCFGDFELFAAESAQMTSAAPASNEPEGDQAKPPASACPLCGLPLDSNGLIEWCENAHVYRVE